MGILSNETKLYITRDVANKYKEILENIIYSCDTPNKELATVTVKYILDELESLIEKYGKLVNLELYFKMTRYNNKCNELISNMEKSNSNKNRRSIRWE